MMVLGNRSCMFSRARLSGNKRSPHGGNQRNLSSRSETELLCISLMVLNGINSAKNLASARLTRRRGAKELSEVSLDNDGS